MSLHRTGREDADDGYSWPILLRETLIIIRRKRLIKFPITGDTEREEESIGRRYCRGGGYLRSIIRTVPSEFNDTVHCLLLFLRFFNMPRKPVLYYFIEVWETVFLSSSLRVKF